MKFLFKHLVFLLLSGNIALISSCKKCENEEDVYALIKPWINEAVPYDSGTVVNFRNLKGDVYPFETIIHHTIAKSYRKSCATCCSGFIQHHWESKSISLYNPLYRFGCEFYLRASDDYYQNASDDYEIMVNCGYANSSGQYFYLQVKADGSFACDDNIICHDSMVIADKAYQDVIEIQLLDARDYYLWIFQMYYSREKGVLKIVFYDNEEFTLVE